MYSDIFAGLEFEYPYVFLTLILFIVCAKFCKAKTESYYIPHLKIFNQQNPVKKDSIFLLKWITIIFALVALASPIKQNNIINQKSDGIDMILSLDTSGSMKQRGFNQQNPYQNRWEVVQEIVGDFIGTRKSDNIGIVVFGSSVMTASPLTFDKKAQKNILKNLNIGIVGEKTALIDSIATSINILKLRDSKSKIIVALTDGDDTASTIPLSIVTKLLKKHDIKLYTIGIGITNRYLLETLSNANGGKSFTALSKNDLQLIYDTINNLEKTKLDQNKILLKEYYFFYPLMISFLALLLLIYLKNKRGSF